MNSIVLTGRLTRDPELKLLDNGNLCSFTLAVDTNNETLFVNCSAFGRIADLMGNTLKKGSLIAISGKLAQRTYEKDTGEKVIAFYVKVSEFDYLEKKQVEEPKSNMNKTPEDIYKELKVEDGFPF